MINGATPFCSCFCFWWVVVGFGLLPWDSKADSASQPFAVSRVQITAIKRAQTPIQLADRRTILATAPRSGMDGPRC